MKRNLKPPTYLFVFSIMLVLQACFPVRGIFLAMPDRKDLERMPSARVQAGEEPFFFYEASNKNECKIKVNDWTNDIPFFVPLDELVKGHAVRSLLVIQNDTILYDYYANGLDKNSLHASYSIAKCFTATLIGIAIDEGWIKSEQALVAQYIPEIPDAPALKSLTIEHLLNHTSGIQYSLPIDGTIYYGDNVLNAVKRIKFAHLPGQKQHYLNINIQLLGLVLHRATQKHPSEYLQEKLWQPLGMEQDGLWTIDRKNQEEKTYCCLGATALDYAKFGRLYLNKGLWGDQRIVSERWYNKSIARDTSAGSSFNYNYCWHLGLKEYQDYMAIGMYKQHIYINHHKNIIIVLLNNREKKLTAERVNWWNVFRQIVDQL